MFDSSFEILLFIGLVSQLFLFKRLFLFQGDLFLLRRFRLCWLSLWFFLRFGRFWLFFRLLIQTKWYTVIWKTKLLLLRGKCTAGLCCGDIPIKTPKAFVILGSWRYLECKQPVSTLCCGNKRWCIYTYWGSSLGFFCNLARSVTKAGSSKYSLVTGLILSFVQISPSSSEIRYMVCREESRDR